MFERLYHSFMDYLPNLLGAIVILVGGVLVAWIIARLVRVVLKKVGLGDRLTRFCASGEEPAKSGCGEKMISQIVFWILFVFVLAGFFHALRLPVISEPLANMVRTIFEYLPRLLAALGLVILAWILAAGVRMLIVNFLKIARFDEKIDKELTESPGAMPKREAAGGLSQTLGNLAYWLVFLLFIPLVLDTLGLQGMLAPVENMFGKIFAFLPNLFVAGLILIVGFFVAKIISRIVTNLLQAAGINRLTNGKKGKPAEGKGLQLATFIGYVVFVLILVPVVIAALQTLQLTSITRPAERMLEKFLAALPHLFTAAALLAIAYFVGRLLARMVSDLLSTTGFDGLVYRIGGTKLPKAGKEGETPPAQGHSPSWVIGQVVLVAVMLFAAEAALRLIEFNGVADLVNQTIAFLGNVILGLIVFGVGLYLGRLAARLIRSSGLSQANILAPLAQAAIIIVMTAMGLERIGIGRDIIRLTFGLTLGALAVAAAIAFGIGSRDLARNVVNKYLGHWGKGQESSK